MFFFSKEEAVESRTVVFYGVIQYIYIMLLSVNGCLCESFGMKLSMEF
jgi:hypothetical protein